jgi:hypothetical protein
MTTETPKLNPSIVVLKTGEKLITVLQEAFEGEGEEQKGICLVMNYPYELDLINVSNVDNPEQDLQVKFSRWCPYSVDTQFRIPYDSVLAIGQPDTGLSQAYQAKIDQAKSIYEQSQAEFSGISGEKTQNEMLQQKDIDAVVKGKVITPEVV